MWFNSRRIYFYNDIMRDYIIWNSIKLKLGISF